MNVTEAEFIIAGGEYFARLMLNENKITKLRTTTMITKFINNSDLKFKDLSDEEYRIYDFGDHQIRIDLPLFLNVSDSGGHRIFDMEGISHYIPYEWIHLSWKVFEGKSNFKF